MTRMHLAVKSSPGRQPWKKPDDLDEETTEEIEAAPEEETPLAEEETPLAEDETVPGEDGEPSLEEDDDGITVGLEPPGDQTEEDPAALGEDPQESSDPAAPQWAGDLYEDGDETDPAQAFGAFRGTSGEQAWLDKAPDGVLTGWVQDASGAVWRYSDADAWAMDVDDAGMTPVSGPQSPAAPDPGQGPPAPAGQSPAPPEQKSVAYRLVATAI